MSRNLKMCELVNWYHSVSNSEMFPNVLSVKYGGKTSPIEVFHIILSSLILPHTNESSMNITYMKLFMFKPDRIDKRIFEQHQAKRLPNPASNTYGMLLVFQCIESNVNTSRPVAAFSFSSAVLFSCAISSSSFFDGMTSPSNKSSAECGIQSIIFSTFLGFRNKKYIGNWRFQTSEGPFVRHLSEYNSSDDGRKDLGNQHLDTLG